MILWILFKGVSKMIESSCVAICSSPHCINCDKSTRKIWQAGFSVKLNNSGSLAFSESVQLYLPEADEAQICSVKVLRLLCILLEHAGKIISKADLESAIWGRIPVGGGSLPVLVNQLRILLKDTSWVVVTARGLGYMILEGKDEQV
ncbi:helix-turn-helix domain-containing protein [Shewanella maritima]|uniref:Helix-turn-helix domain-containing protein n=1 Tax=Shewanella maritima TaxID=2520507 RepID=A0A411PGQ1_9GAMM|nr:helix-turn-helix domain-containing protein [Shewanella maritima]QBF82634.1 helix-turn-helix domain-containing protein [Shewanella maritima]